MRFPRIVAFLVCVAVSSLPLFAQSPNGNINGLVSDPSSAAVGGAEIVAVNDVTGVQYTTKSNSEGIYVLPNLPTGPYRVQVSKIGFKTLIKPDIVLNVQDSLSINFTLLVGAFHEIVTVEGGAPLVNTESAAVSTVVDQTYIKNMPLNGRSFQDLILLTPGIVTSSPQGGVGGEFSVNGQRTQENYYTVDGVSANVGTQSGQAQLNFGPGVSGSAATATALGTTQALVSVDDLQEFRAQSSTYSAEYGRNPGGQFAFETKSGTNEWHATAYDYLRNGFFDAQDWFNDYFDVKAPALHQNDFGGTLGGPLTLPRLYDGRDKTFVFVSYEGLRLAVPQAASINFVPDSALRSSAPAAEQQALNAYPLPNGPDVGNGIAEFIGSWSNPSSLNSSSVRFDHSVNDKLRLFFRFSDTTSRSVARGAYSNFDAPTVLNVLSYATRTYTTGITTAFTSHLSNQIRLNYSSNESTNSQTIDAFGGSAPVNLAQLSSVGSGSWLVFDLAYNGYFINIAQAENIGAQKQWNLVDTQSFSFGRHQLEVGADYRRLAPTSITSSPFLAYGVLLLVLARRRM